MFGKFGVFQTKKGKKGSDIHMTWKKKRLTRCLMIRMSEELWIQLNAVTGPGFLTKSRWIRTVIRHGLKCSSAQEELNIQGYSRSMKWPEPK